MRKIACKKDLLSGSFKGPMSEDLWSSDHFCHWRFPHAIFDRTSLATDSVLGDRATSNPAPHKIYKSIGTFVAGSVANRSGLQLVVDAVMRVATGEDDTTITSRLTADYGVNGTDVTSLLSLIRYCKGTQGANSWPQRIMRGNEPEHGNWSQMALIQHLESVMMSRNVFNGDVGIVPEHFSGFAVARAADLSWGFSGVVDPNNVEWLRDRMEGRGPLSFYKTTRTVDSCYATAGMRARDEYGVLATAMSAGYTQFMTDNGIEKCGSSEPIMPGTFILNFPYINATYSAVEQALLAGGFSRELVVRLFAMTGLRTVPIHQGVTLLYDGAESLSVGGWRFYLAELQAHRVISASGSALFAGLPLDGGGSISASTHVAGGPLSGFGSFSLVSGCTAPGQLDPPRYVCHRQGYVADEASMNQTIHYGNTRESAPSGSTHGTLNMRDGAMSAIQRSSSWEPGLRQGRHIDASGHFLSSYGNQLPTLGNIVGLELRPVHVGSPLLALTLQSNVNVINPWYSKDLKTYGCVLRDRAVAGEYCRAVQAASATSSLDASNVVFSANDATAVASLYENITAFERADANLERLLSEVGNVLKGGPVMFRLPKRISEISQDMLETQKSRVGFPFVPDMGTGHMALRNWSHNGSRLTLLVPPEAQPLVMFGLLGPNLIIPLSSIEVDAIEESPLMTGTRGIGPTGLHGDKASALSDLVLGVSPSAAEEDVPPGERSPKGDDVLPSEERSVGQRRASWGSYSFPRRVYSWSGPLSLPYQEDVAAQGPPAVLPPSQLPTVPLRSAAPSDRPEDIYEKLVDALEQVASLDGAVLPPGVTTTDDDGTVLVDAGSAIAQGDKITLPSGDTLSEAIQKIVSVTSQDEVHASMVIVADQGGYAPEQDKMAKITEAVATKDSTTGGNTANPDTFVKDAAGLKGYTDPTMPWYVLVCIILSAIDIIKLATASNGDQAELEQPVSDSSSVTNVAPAIDKE